VERKFSSMIPYENTKSIMNGLRMYDKSLLPKFRMELSQSEVNRIIKRLPLSDSLAALDYMARTVWESPEYDINEWGYWVKL
jgi:hypothetical protein